MPPSACRWHYNTLAKQPRLLPTYFNALLASSSSHRAFTSGNSRPEFDTRVSDEKDKSKNTRTRRSSRRRSSPLDRNPKLLNLIRADRMDF